MRCLFAAWFARMETVMQKLKIFHWNSNYFDYLCGTEPKRKEK